MKCTLVGIKRVDYISKKTSKQVLGWNLYITHPADNVEGIVAEDVYCNDEMTSSVNSIKPQMGKEISVYFNRFGGVESLESVSR